MVVSSEPYTLKLTTHAAASLEAALQQSAGALLMDAKRLGCRDLRGLVWHLLQPHHARAVATVAAAGEWLDRVDMEGALYPALKGLAQINAPEPPLKPSAAKRRGSPPKRRSWRELHHDARQIGIASAQFWEMSPREVAREFEAAAEVQKDRFDRVRTLAWLIEMLNRQKTLPSLKRFLSDMSREQTVQEQRAQLAVLSEQYGIPFRTRSRKASKGRVRDQARRG